MTATMHDASRFARRLTPFGVLVLIFSLLLPAVGFASTPTRDGYGVLSVELTPDVSASIYVDGVARNTVAIRGLQLPAGEHDVCFGPAESHVPPACDRVTIAEGATTNVVGEYGAAGTLVVDAEPAGLAATVTVDGVERDRAPLKLLHPVGNAEVCFSTIHGYTTPECTEVDIKPGDDATLNVTYEPVVVAPVFEPIVVSAVEASSDDGNVADNVLDGDLNTRWSAHGEGQWLQADLGGAVALDSISLAWHRGDQRRSIFELEVSQNGSSWTQALSRTETSGTTTQLEGYALDGVEARFVRLVGYGNTAATSRLWTSITSLELSGVWLPEQALPSEPLGVATVDSSSADGVHVVGNVVDGDLATRWSAEGDGEWLRAYLGGTATLEEIDLSWFRGDQRRSSFSIEVSDDGSAWDEVLPVTQSSGTTLQPEKYKLEAASARFVRLVGFGNDATGGPAPWTSLTTLGVNGHGFSADATPWQPPPEDVVEPPVASTVEHGADLKVSDVGLTGAKLTASGPVKSSHNGQVIENLDVSVRDVGNSGIRISHSDVTVRNVRVRHANGANGVRIDKGALGIRVEHSHFDGMRSNHFGNWGSTAVMSHGEVEVYRVFIEKGRDAVHIYGGNSSIVESWVDSVHTNPDAHNDGLSYRGSSGSNVLIARNRINYDGVRAGGVTLFAEHGPIRDTQVLDNLIVGVNGRGFGLYGGWTHAGKGYRGSNQNIRIEGNRFSGTFEFPDVVGEGTNAGVNLSQKGNTFTNNRWTGSNTNLRARCGVATHSC